MTAIVEVVAAIFQRENGDFLLAQRPEGKVYAGYWEFPGGKVEPDESLHAALVREIREELNVTVTRAWPWLSCQFTYPHATVRLKFFRVPAWEGDIVPIEHSGVVWVHLGESPAVAPVLPANGPILQALALPQRMVCIDAAGQNLDWALADGVRLFCVRTQGLTAQAALTLAQEVVARARGFTGAKVLLDEISLVEAAGADGVCFSSERLRALEERPHFPMAAAHCRTPQDLNCAQELGLDFVLFGPVSASSEAGALGWPEFGESIQRLALPVFAHGDLAFDRLEEAWEHGAHGIASEL